MGHAIPKQHPAVVLRSQFNLVRGLLAVAMVALVGMTIAVVILANDDPEVQTIQPSQAAPVVPNASSLPAYPTPAPEAVSPGNRDYSGAAPTRKLDGSTDIPSPAPVAKPGNVPGFGTSGAVGIPCRPRVSGAEYERRVRLPQRRGRFWTRRRRTLLSNFEPDRGRELCEA